ncbi:hypothetical protein SAMN05216266_13511 [Amycolatopsis marina]|uniref:Uncharacterized protein n=1 Tax=Amycolatopsis marina TaxID=490629 RepID=A0A1I1CS83_9PSEU|nr:hypothetical protein [Amycolatopsis marina]SFB63440.1 hypothetical protein SAMN05216266_13511 [Amycolatopsis marina]
MLTSRGRARFRRAPVSFGSVLLVSALAVVAPAGLSGCGPDCTEAELRVPPVAAESPQTPLTLRGTLTSDGAPVSGARLAFYSVRAGGKGSLIGYGTTDGSGTGELVVGGGLAALPYPPESVTGYEVTFDVLDTVDGVRYCETRATAALS